MGKKTIHFLIVFLLITAGNIFAVEDTKAGSEQVTAASGVINIRQGPGLSYPIVQKASRGDVFTVIDRKDGWIKINLGQTSGWIADYLVTSSPADADVSTASVSATNLRIRQSPGTESSVIGALNQNETVSVLNESGDWAKISANGISGWVAKEFLVFRTNIEPAGASNSGNESAENVTILYNGTNLRDQPTVHSSIVQTANAGETYSIENEKNQWYKIRLSNGQAAYIASWVVSVSKQKNTISKTSSAENGIKGKTIIIDPGHGGYDNGTTGVSGLLEKMMTLRTAELLKTKLEKEGANAVLTRNTDRYISLNKRVSISELNGADAFISIHYDSDSDPAVSGHTTYYNHQNQKKLAESIDRNISAQVLIPDRGVRFGDFHVIRENPQPAVLLELGYLSSPRDVQTVRSANYQDTVTTGILNGILQYFK